MKKKTLYSLLVIGVLMISIMPLVMANSGTVGIGLNMTNPGFAPRVWMCDSRIVTDDNTEPGKVSPGGSPLIERLNNYAFEGEKIHWTVLVMDKNKIDQNIDVYATIGDPQGAGNDIQANCQRIGCNQSLMPSCNARIQEENITTCNPAIMDMFDCTYTVETPEIISGQYWLTVEATDGDGLNGTMAENEYWYFNPVVSLSITGDMTFNDVMPGTDAYSETMLVGNDADTGSGVMLDMFIGGTDFYDSSSSGARCPTTNQLSLSAFRYFATNGAYSTLMDARADAEGYVGIGYATSFNNPNPFYGSYEIMHTPLNTNNYFAGNILAPGQSIPITFKLSLPEPCNGNFDSGSINFWGEAI